MKQKRVFTLIILFLLIFSCNVFASKRPEPNAIFMGEVEEVQKSDSDNIIRIKVNGYIKGLLVGKQELVGIISQETLILPDTLPKEGEEVDIKKVNTKDFKIKKGDVVFLVLSEAMTKSNPPQASVRAIQVTSKN